MLRIQANHSMLSRLIKLWTCRLQVGQLTIIGGVMKSERGAGTGGQSKQLLSAMYCDAPYVIVEPRPRRKQTALARNTLGAPSANARVRL